MNFLLLLDAVPNFHPFLVQLGNALERQGHRACYVLETPLNNHRYREHAVTGRVRVFSEFHAQRPQETAPDQAARVGSWEAFFSDFDRYEHYGVNHGRGQDWYARLACALSHFFLACLRDWQIDAVVYEGNTNSFAWYANQAARETGATFIGLQQSRLPGRHELVGGSEDTLRQRVHAAYDALAAGQLQPSKAEHDWVATYLQKFDEAVPDYMLGCSSLTLVNPVKRYAKSRHLRTLWRLATYQMQGNAAARTSYRSGPPLTYSLIHIRLSMVRWLRSKLLPRYFTPPAKRDRFFLYPIHFHPEASTSVNARWYMDDPVIKNLALSLPFGTWLYAKDHLSAEGYPPVDFYRRVSRLPNVKLISPRANTKQLIRDSIGVITLTSTVGYEALVLRKPVWLLGEVFYDFHPGCAKVGWNDALPGLLARPPQKPVTEADARRLVMAYSLSTKQGTLPLDGECPGTVTFDQLAAEVAEQTRSMKLEPAEGGAGNSRVTELKKC